MILQFFIVLAISQIQNMAQFTTTISINADVTHIWAVLADVQHWSQWTASVTKTELLDAPPLRKGSRVRIFQPKLRPAVWIITEWEENDHFTWVSESPGVRVTATHNVRKSEAGCTVELGIEMHGILAPVVKLFAGKLTEEYLAIEAAGLKKECEKE